MAFIYNLTDTWNNGATVFTAIKMNVTNTASAASSKLFDLQVASSSLFSVDKSGVAAVSGGISTGGGGVQSTISGVIFSGTALFSGAGLGSITIGEVDGFFKINNNAGTTPTRFGTPATATFQLGLVDAAGPVAQTLRVQSVVAGTSNTAGANWTFKGSAGTGTGIGGSIIFQVAPAGSTGTAQNAFSTALTIDSVTNANFAKNVTAVNGFISAGTSATGASAGDLSAARTTTSGVVYLGSDGGVYLFRSASTLTQLNGSDLQLSSGRVLQWNADAILSRAGAAAFQLGAADAAAAVAQTLRVQSVVAGTAAANGANWTFIGSLPTGTGTSGDIIFQTGVKTGSGTTQGTATTAMTIKGETQNVNFAGTTSALQVNATQVHVAGSATAIPAGGSTTVAYLATTTGGFGVYFGSGAPTVSAAKGSLYLRSNGTGATDRAYINTDGSTTWTNLVTGG